MAYVDMILISVALAMDALAVSVCQGFAHKPCRFRLCLWVGLWFGVFQTGMPLLGYYLGARFATYITAMDHWLVFLILGGIGLHMFKESFEEEDEERRSLGLLLMLGLSLATSVDAFAVGISFALLPDIAIPTVFVLIGLITFALSATGMMLGSVFTLESRYATRLGGVLLVGMGLKILVEHLGFIPLP